MDLQSLRSDYRTVPFRSGAERPEREFELVLGCGGEDSSPTIDLTGGRERQGPREGTFYEHYLKRLVDVVGASLILVVLSPVLVITSLLVLLTMGWPLFFTQPRVGRYGELFNMIKFRSMEPDRRVDEREFDGPNRRVDHKSAVDPRHTRIGRFMRVTSMDELPQLVNVLRGEMSLVGPRPEMPEIAASIETSDRSHELVRPGMTGPWQVFSRDPADRDLRLELDQGYVRRITAVRDLKFMVRTFTAIVNRTGA